MHLVLTADKRFWPEDGEDLVYLGGWCVPGNDDARVMPYPYDDRKYLYKSYLKLQKIYGDFLELLVPILNEMHEVNYDRRYWEIIVGYWLREFIEVLYERYICIKKAGELYPDAKVLTAGVVYTPKDGGDFERRCIDDEYNQQIYSQIANYLRLFNCKVVKVTEQYKSSMDAPRPTFLKQAVKWGCLLASRWNKVFLVSCYFPNKTFIKLALKLKIFPTLNTPTFRLGQPPLLSENLRSHFSGLKFQDEFSMLLGHLLHAHFPTLYVENYCKHARKVARWFPRKPCKLIMTANGFSVNEAFKFWTASQIFSFKTPFYILQHGGHYGCGLWNSSEDYETNIADRYLTYGWKDSKKANVKPFFASRIPYHDKRLVFGDPNGDILWVLASFPRYSYTMYSVPCASQLSSYFSFQVRFLKGLAKELFSLVRCRTYVYDFGWDILTYIDERVPKLALANLKQSMQKNLKSSRLCVIAYHATAHLETFSLNMPTLLVWDKSFWEMRAEAESLYQNLQEVGVLHYSPESAARKINEIGSDVATWWNQQEIKKAVEDFCHQYVNVSNDPVDSWSKLCSLECEE